MRSTSDYTRSGGLRSMRRLTDTMPSVNVSTRLTDLKHIGGEITVSSATHPIRIWNHGWSVVIDKRFEGALLCSWSLEDLNNDGFIRGPAAAWFLSLIVASSS